MIEKDDLNTIQSSKRIDITPVVKNLVEIIADDGTICAYVGSYVQDCILAYCEKSYWHIEEDRMWFAPEGVMPQRPWIIDSETNEDEFEFWFTNETVTVMEYIGDFSEAFLTWYHGECDFRYPDMDKIRSYCPFIFEFDETVQSVIAKCKLYLNSK